MPEPTKTKLNVADKVNEIEKPDNNINFINIPTEQVDLPSRGLLYSKENVLSQGFVNMKYMTAREEDILTNENLITQGKALDKLFESLITTKPMKYGDLLIGDRNAILVAARILSYGHEYKIKTTTPSGNEEEFSVDLTKIKPKELNEEIITPGVNEFTFTTPKSGNVIVFKLLTVQDEREIENRLAQWKKMNKFGTLTARLRQMIISVDGDTNAGHIAQWIDNQFLATDTRAFRKYINQIQPNLNFEIELYDGVTGDSFREDFTPGLDFFWPDAKV